MMTVSISSRTAACLRRLSLSALAGLALQAVFAPAAAADAYPDRPVTLVAPYPAGGAVDIVARVLAQGLSAKLGKPVVVDNRPGAGGTVGGGLVARSRPDGYTLLLATDGSLIVGPLVVSPAPYQLSAFTPVSRFASSPLLLVTKPTQPYADMHAFLEAARKRPDALTLGSPGVGTPPHLMIERMQLSTGVRVTHVPYKGGAPIVTDLLGGIIDASFCTMAGCGPLVRDGSMKALGVSSAQRSPLLPSVPTFAEQGIKGMDADNWFGLAGPAGMPAAVVSTLAAAVSAVTNSADFQRQMRDAGIDMAQPRSPEALKAYLEQERASMAKLLAAKPLAK